MSLYQIDNYNIYLKSNTIRITTFSKRVFQSELNYNDFILCENEEDLFILLDNYLSKNEIIFTVGNNNIIASIKINLPPLKTKEITFMIPEIREIMDIKDAQIIKLNSIIKDFNTKFDMLSDKIKELEERSNNRVFLEGSKIGIFKDITDLVLFGPGVAHNYGELYNHQFISSNKYYFEHKDISNIKYLNNLVKLKIEHNYITSDFSDLKYLDKLEELEFTCVEKLTDISFCKYLTKLRILKIKSCLLIEDINILAQCENLVELHINGSSNIKNTQLLINPKLKINK